MRPSQSRGVTMLELLVCVAIVAIVVAIGVPSMRSWMMAQRVGAIGTELLTDVQLARAEAVSRSTFVNVSFGTGSGFTCYTIYVAINGACNCALGVGNACTVGAAAANTEIKTVVIPSSTGVTVALPGPFLQYTSAVQFGNANAARTISVSDGDIHRLSVVVSPNLRRPTICTPTGYTLNGFKPC